MMTEQPQAPPQAASNPPGMQPPGQAGPTGQATVAPDPQGNEMRGRTVVALSMKALGAALNLLGPDTPAGQCVAKAIAGLGKEFGSASPSLQSQEVKMLGDQAQPVSTPGPESMDAFRSEISKRLPQPAPAGQGGY